DALARTVGSRRNLLVEGHGFSRNFAAQGFGVDIADPGYIKRRRGTVATEWTLARDRSAEVSRREHGKILENCRAHGVGEDLERDGVIQASDRLDVDERKTSREHGLAAVDDPPI